MSRCAQQINEDRLWRNELVLPSFVANHLPNGPAPHRFVTVTSMRPRSGSASFAKAARLRSILRPSLRRYFAGPRSVITTTTLRFRCVTTTLVPKSKNHDAPVSLSGLNRWPLAIGRPRCFSPYHDARSAAGQARHERMRSAASHTVVGVGECALTPKHSAQADSPFRKSLFTT